MKDIQLAIEKENEYLYRKLNEGDASADIYDYIGLAGYSDVNEFYWDKQEYYMKRVSYVVVEEPEIDLTFPNPYYDRKQPAFLYTIDCDYDYAFIPLGFTRLDLVEQYNLVPLQIGYTASNGVIVSTSGDLRIYLILPGDIEVRGQYFLNHCAELLSSRFPDSEVVVNENDVLLDGKKVMGSVLMRYRDMNVFLFQATFSDKREMIESICGVVPKTPGFIDPEVLSAAELKDEFLSWLRL